MNRIIHAINRIHTVPGAHVDRSFRQGADVVLAQLRHRNPNESASGADRLARSFQEDIHALHAWIKPHHVPDAYGFFLEWCGGLLIKPPAYNLIVQGIGPMVEEWYSFIMGDDTYVEPHHDGVLAISELVFKAQPDGSYPLIIFFIDLAGIVQRHGILGIGPWHADAPDLPTILQNVQAHQDRWRVVAPSFGEWLDLVADTHGRLGYDLDRT